MAGALEERARLRPHSPERAARGQRRRATSRARRPHCSTISRGARPAPGHAAAARRAGAAGAPDAGAERGDHGPARADRTARSRLVPRGGRDDAQRHDARHGLGRGRAAGRVRGRPGDAAAHTLGARRRPLEPVRAMLVGGYFGAWVEGDGVGLTLDEASLRARAAGSARASWWCSGSPPARRPRWRASPAG